MMKLGKLSTTQVVLDCLLITIFYRTINPESHHHHRHHRLVTSLVKTQKRT